ncbi:DUF6657 family protein [Thermodesulfobacterium hveragerdense]|uniref:DUF6657 family protein n=1 Tax=Thermodesulfobacterium hveragerdense TaxID=53424 RepID=UPI0003FEFA18|nr:DUF6657 family protein [Thermodesulfobacterium hveragerdense]
MPDEIRSSLEIALEKAEKIGKASKEELKLFELQEEAQRLAAKFLREETSDFRERLETMLKDKKPQEKKAILKGVVQVFLRNIVLPLNENQLEDAKIALKGLKLVFEKMSEMDRLLKEIEKLLIQYNTHKEAIYQEMVKRFSAEIEMLEQALSNQLGAEVHVEPENHPKFKEEWGRIKERLDEEYNRQLEYLKGIFNKIVS